MSFQFSFVTLLGLLLLFWEVLCRWVCKWDSHSVKESDKTEQLLHTLLGMVFGRIQSRPRVR